MEPWKTGRGAPPPSTGAWPGHFQMSGKNGHPLPPPPSDSWVRPPPHPAFPSTLPIIWVAHPQPLPVPWVAVCCLPHRFLPHFPPWPRQPPSVLVLWCCGLLKFTLALRIFCPCTPYCRPRREGLLSQPSSVQRTSKITPCLDPNPTYQHMLSRKLFQLFRPPASFSIFCGEPPNSLAKLLEPMF